MKACLLVNSLSGGWVQRGPLLNELAKQAGIPTIDLAHGESKQASVFRRIIVAGGDGTFARVVNAMSDRLGELEFALLPLGTGNDLSRSLGVSDKSIEGTWQDALTAKTRQIDLVRVTNGHQFYMVNVATGGFGGMVSTDVTSQEKRRWGSMAYWLTAFSKLSELHEARVRLELDDETIDMTTYGLAVANGKFVGGGFPVAPDALLDDGLLDITVVPILPTLELLASGVDFVLGRHHAADRVRTMKSARCRVFAEPRLTYSFDGEAICGYDATFEVVPRGLQIV